MSMPLRLDRRLLVRLHRYGGLVLGTWFVLLGLSGAILVYRDAIDLWLNPTLLSSAAHDRAVGVEAVIASARREFPDGLIERVRVPDDRRGAYRVLMRENARLRVGSRRVEATFDAADGRLLGTRDPDERSLRPVALLQTVHDLHHRILLGNTGKDLVGVVGLILALMALAGLVLAFPNLRMATVRRAVSLKWRAGATRVGYDLHRSIGVAAGALLVLAGSTGALLAYPEYARDLIGLASPVRSLPAVPFPTGAREADPAAAIAAIAARYPGHRMSEVHLPGPRGALVLVYLHVDGDVHRLGDTLIVAHALNGEVLVERGPAQRTAGEESLHWLLPLHSGTAFGPLGRALAFAAGLAPLVLSVTGVIVWLAKRRARRHRIAMHNAATGRGTS